MQTYRLPELLTEEIRNLDRRIGDYHAGTITAAELKTARVPFGIYEQRTKNTYMVRIRCAAGIITPRQLGVVAALAGTFSAGRLHITTRQEIQIHDVNLDDMVPLLTALADAGLSTRGGGGNTVRNITASPDAGIAPGEPFDVTPCAVELTNRMIADHGSWLLPRKFKIAFSNTADDTAYAAFNDLGFIAVTRDGEKGFSVFVAGGMGRNAQPGTLLHEFIPVSDVYLVAESVKRLFSRYGNRRNRHAARLRYLWNRLGRERFIQLYDEEKKLLVAEQPQRFDHADRYSAKSSETVRLRPHRQSQEFSSWKSRYVIPQKRTGFFSAVIPLSNGDVTASHLQLLADFLSAAGDDTVRFAQQQNILLRNIPESHLPGLHFIIRKTTPWHDQPAVIGNAVSCTGAQTCQLGICRSRNALRAVLLALADDTAAGDAAAHLHLHISGCPNSCGQHLLADLGFAGKAATFDGHRYPAYTVFAGARRNAAGSPVLGRKMGEIPAKALPPFTLAFIRHHAENRGSDETFGQYLDSCGFDVLSSLVSIHSRIPSFDDDPSFYRDLGTDDPFSLDGRGTGECAAGLFDLVHIDISRMHLLREEVTGTPFDASAIATFRTLATTACRALLVTRGRTVTNDRRAFDLFTRHFIDEGLLPHRFAATIAALLRNDDITEPLSRDIVALTFEVDRLYDALDDTMQVKRPPSRISNLKQHDKEVR